MKKVIVLCALLLLALSGCSNQKKLEKAIDKIDNNDNMTVHMIMETGSEEDNIEFTIKMDGDTEYIYADFGLIMEQYIVTEDGEEFTYTYVPEFQDEWFKEPYEEDENAAEEFVEYESLNSEWFTYDDGVYTLEEAYYDVAFSEEETEYISSFIIRLDDEDVIMEMVFEEDGDEISVTFRFYDFGETTIDLSPIE